MGSQALGITSPVLKMYQQLLVLFSLIFVVLSQVSLRTKPPPDQRCSGRIINGARRCCTPENPCELGEGDCNGPLDGGVNDKHDGCKGDLQCGSDNCLKFGLYFHERDDCCDLPQNVPENNPTVFFLGAPLEPPAGQICSGRNFNGRRCCTPENPCSEGEGDCDGPEEGGKNDGDSGCKGDLICGSNNCKKFGNYYHEKDDCCEKPTNETRWGPWSQFGPCSSECGIGWTNRTRKCIGNRCGTSGHHLEELQERICFLQNCSAVNSIGTTMETTYPTETFPTEKVPTETFPTITNLFPTEPVTCVGSWGPWGSYSYSNGMRNKQRTCAGDCEQPICNE